MTQIMTPPMHESPQEQQGPLMNPMVAAVGLLVATILGYLAILVPLARRGAQAGGDDRWFGAGVAVSILALGFVLALPGVLWYRKRAATWATWRATSSMPWLAWGPRLLVVFGLLVAGNLQDTLYWIGQIASSMGGDTRGVGNLLALQGFNVMRSLVTGIGAAVCVIGLAGSATPEMLSKWIHRSIYVLCAICVLLAMAWPMSLIRDALISGQTP